MAIFLIGLILFIGIHTVRVIAPEWRLAQIEKRGEGAWKGMYSAISILGFLLLVYGYSLWRPEAEIAYVPPDWGRGVTYILMLASFILLVAGNGPTGYIKQTVQHPMVIGVVFWGVAHLLANGDYATVVLAGVIFAWATIDMVDSFRRDGPKPVATGVVPDVVAVVIGAGLWFLFLVWAHGWLFGVALT